MFNVVMTLVEDKRFLCVWLLYDVSNFADSRVEEPRYRSSPTSCHHFFLSGFSSSEVLVGKNASIRSKLPTAACWSREEKSNREEGVLSQATLTT